MRSIFSVFAHFPNCQRIVTVCVRAHAGRRCVHTSDVSKGVALKKLLSLTAGCVLAQSIKTELVNRFFDKVSGCFMRYVLLAWYGHKGS